MSLPLSGRKIVTIENGLRTFRAIPKEDGTVQYEELKDTWRPIVILPGQNMASDAEVAEAILTHSELPDAHHPQEHSHPTHGDIDLVGSLSVNGHRGKTGSRVIGGIRITAEEGVIVGFEPA